MPPFTLDIFVKIVGIGAASGLLRFDDSLFLISDNAAFLYQYSLAHHTLTKMPIVRSEPMESIPKHLKHDFESIASWRGTIYVLGSGSTPKREKVAKVSIDGDCELQDLSGLYHKMREVSGLKKDDLNIEGAAFANDRLYLMQRGNGPANKNGIFATDPDFSGKDLRYFDLSIEDQGERRFGFTDMAIHNGKMYFTGAAENVSSTYLDGEIQGSVFGTIDIGTMKIEKTILISSTQKFEGLTFYKESNGKISFLLCEDTDGVIAETTLYLLTIEK